VEQSISAVIQKLFNVEQDVILTRPEPQFGDYATNVAMQLAKPLGKNPRQVAEAIVAELQTDEDIADITIAGPGFINITLTNSALIREVYARPIKIYDGQTIVAEYSDPNPFKVLHAGHLYTTLIGDTISRLLAVAGGNVHRVNFGGDVGPHVAMNMWAIIQTLGGEYPEKLAYIDDDLHKRAGWLAARYVEGRAAYDNDEAAKAEILVMNKQVYQLHADDDTTSPFAKIYWECRQWSYDYFALLYDELGVLPFEKYYPESATTPIGVETVERELVNGVYEKSDGAIVFKGELYGLHTRVFINSQGLPTYEAKDVGLIMQKWADYHFDLSVIITGDDITEYMKVVQKSIEQFEPELVARSRHLTHGNLKLTGGRKMSSRKGEVLLALDVLQAARDAQVAQHGTPNEEAVLGAVKYAFLKAKIGGEIIYNPEESVSLQGNSGPYLQYAHARARRILEKSNTEFSMPRELYDEDRMLVRKLGEYHEVVSHAIRELAPHHICNYLFELAQEFNRYYEKNQVVGSDKEAHRAGLVTLYADTVKAGLTILGISAPEKM
jgi:arginyl-tRNA synthetase